MGCNTMKFNIKALGFTCSLLVVVTLLALSLTLAACSNSSSSTPAHYAGEVAYSAQPCPVLYQVYIPTQPMLAVLHITHDEFLHSIAHPRIFPYRPTGQISAGVVPHHSTAAVLISGFFAQAAISADDDYDLVIILAPNHEGDLAGVVLSYRDWDIGEGVFTHSEFVHSLHSVPGINTAICHSRMELDHSASILIPYIYHYLPGAKVAPVLLNRSLSFDATVAIFHWLNNWIAESDKNVLLVASIDFSHFLSVPQSRENDAATKEAIFANDLKRLHEMNYHYLDSPAAMIIFLMYLEKLGLVPKIIEHTDASEFLGPWVGETTSYMVIVGSIDGLTNKHATYVQLTFTGDIMLHQAQANVAFNPGTGTYDFTPTFYAVRPFLQNADLTIGNLETVFAGFFQDTKERFTYANELIIGDNTGIFPRFSAPDEFGHALKDAGFNILSTANNHSLDQGVAGLLRNLDFLYKLGIDSFGTYRSRQERETVLVREVEGIRFAFLSYTFSTNGQPIPSGREYLINLIYMPLIQADIARARQLADFVIIMPHLGYEYELTVRRHIQDLAMEMLAAGADIVVAGHPHVLQPMDIVDIACHATGETRKGFVAYCLGNFISAQRKPHTYTGVMLNLYFKRIGDSRPEFTGFSYVPTIVNFADYTIQVLY